MDFLKKLSDAIRFTDDDFDDDDDEEYYREIAKLEKKKKEKEKAEKSRRNASALRTREALKDKKNSYTRDRRETGSPSRNVQNSRNNVSQVKKTLVSQGTSRQTDNYSSKRVTRSDNLYRLRESKAGISFYDARTFEDAQLVCDKLADGNGVIVRFSKSGTGDSQRVMDFIAGCVYAINGNIHAASDEFFIFTPKGMELSGDEIASMIKDSGFGVPTFNKML